MSGEGKAQDGGDTLNGQTTEQDGPADVSRIHAIETYAVVAKRSLN